MNTFSQAGDAAAIDVYAKTSYPRNPTGTDHESPSDNFRSAGLLFGQAYVFRIYFLGNVLMMLNDSSSRTRVLNVGM